MSGNTRAELARAVADLAEQQANFERLAALLADGFTDRASYSVAEARVESARANVDLWQTRVDFGRVASTLNGVVTERLVEPGEAVSQYAPLLVLADTDNLVVRFGLSELDVSGVQPGMPVAIDFDALRNAVPVQGTVRRVMPTTEGPSRLVTVEVALPPTACRHRAHRISGTCRHRGGSSAGCAGRTAGCGRHGW
jgi:membrane fusion protein, multidrug efflux system